MLPVDHKSGSLTTRPLASSVIDYSVNFMAKLLLSLLPVVLNFDAEDPKKCKFLNFTFISCMDSPCPVFGIFCSRCCVPMHAVFAVQQI